MQVLKPELHNKVWVKAFQLIIKERRSCTLNPNRKVLCALLHINHEREKSTELQINDEE